MMINSSSLSTPAPAASTRRSWAAAQSAHRPKHLLRIAQLPTLDWEVETSRMDLLNPCNNASQYDKEHLFWDASVYFELHKFPYLPWFYLEVFIFWVSMSFFNMFNFDCSRIFQATPIYRNASCRVQYLYYKCMLTDVYNGYDYRSSFVI